MTPLESQQQWRRVRDYLNENRFALTQHAVRSFPDELRVAGTPLLARPAWLPDAPVPLADVRLEWEGDGVPAPITGAEPELGHILPRQSDGTPVPSYAGAVEALARPRLFENRKCYRLLAADAATAAPVLSFGRGQYFDVINICEAIGHEYAAAALAAPEGAVPAASAMPFRAAVGDPTDLAQRPVMAAISTLTIRHDRSTGDAEFVLHWRDPERVATGGGLHQVTPVGMFQPSHDACWNEAHDFGLWQSIVRELSEELLGSSEEYGSDKTPIDYAAWPFNAALEEARSTGRLRVFWMGLGIDSLTYVSDMLTVAVFDADLFDTVFPRLAATNEEGHLVAVEDNTGRAFGIPFRADHVERLTTEEQMQPAGAALLRLAWDHRSALLAHDRGPHPL
ncbi:XRE family transcriptional regulator [Streptomyces javensis]|uniref:XRE family transcriptional regulator n=1 Tax=Streptomyces javensis TaxID=114698 RepID=A0ABS0R5Y7_9ACTN|nr:XRE family transcriptional regulator [Streptomyces javensis]MBI0312720.1 XRE family transcriptional regulator [Streptomyces javensis]